MIHEHNNYSLLPHNTFGIDVKASSFLEYDTVAELRKLLEDGRITEPWLHIGSGSNLLFLQDFKGTVLHSCINSIELLEETAETVSLRVGAGVIWDDFVSYCVENQWYGAENLSLIPGEVGASAVQNIGAYGVEVKDLIQSVETVDVTTATERLFLLDDCHYSYRHSIFKEPEMQKYIVTFVCFQLNKKEGFTLNYGSISEELKVRCSDLTLENVRQVIIDVRNSKLPDPKVVGNAGSFFMNPVVKRSHYKTLKEKYSDIPCYDVDSELVKIPAAWMIDRCGWKGYSIGQVGIHDKQALVLINKGGAKGVEVAELAQEIKQSVFNKFQIEIFPEVKFV
ncbi:UDP-N-acetylmuramate dehydrogenase [uncultured Bacteroides sp.]|uniref:UDP-N-acetylmuramate dehydrogenase n=1 Tax=uncultured Bacteroides sp. TaxID=162156 RepID=UPI002AAAB483|nr:UDP-N-acetylmuramate dehydrogenase [uncultured Bacteroides sp.]